MKEMYHSLSKIFLALVLVFGLSLAAPAASDAAAPVLSLSPSSGPIGIKVTVSVCNMTPGNTVVAGNITFGGIPWNPSDITIDSSGCMCATVLTVPAAPTGPQAIVIGDGDVTATGVFTLTQPNIAVSPSSGYKGETVTVTGTGWLNPSLVSVTFGGSFIDTVMPNSVGGFSTQFIVPLTAQASNIVGASDNIGNAGPAKIFTLKPAGLTVSPSSGLPGTLVQLTGVGFQPYSGVENLRIASSQIYAPGLITDNVGAFITTFEAPSLPGGGRIVYATVAGLTIDTCFTIIEPDVWVPLDEDLPTPVEEALASISDRLIRVWGFHDGEWQMYDPNDPLGSTLTGLVSGRAYWIKVSEDCALIFRDLQAGWNNIGW